MPPVATRERNPVNEPSTDRIRDLLSQVAYILDAHDYDRLGEVFAEDVRRAPGSRRGRSSKASSST